MIRGGISSNSPNSRSFNYSWIVIVIFGFVPFVPMLVVTPPRVIVVLLFFGMAMGETMAVLVNMIVQVFVLDLTVRVRMRMQVVMQVAVFMFMLQLPDFGTVALTIHIGQPVEVSESLVLQKGVDRHILQNPTLVHHHGPAGQLLDEKHVVTDQQKGYVQIAQDRQQQLLPPGIEPGRRFVQYEEPGFHGEYAGQGQTLAFAPGQVKGNTLLETIETHHRQGFFNSSQRFGLGMAELLQAESHFFFHARAEKLIRTVLEDHADLSPQRPATAACHGPSVKKEGSSSRM